QGDPGQPWPWSLFGFRFQVRCGLLCWRHRRGDLFGLFLRRPLHPATPPSLATRPPSKPRSAPPSVNPPPPPPPARFPPLPRDARPRGRPVLVLLAAVSPFASRARLAHLLVPVALVLPLLLVLLVLAPLGAGLAACAPGLLLVPPACGLPSPAPGRRFQALPDADEVIVLLREVAAVHVVALLAVAPVVLDTDVGVDGGPLGGFHPLLVLIGGGDAGLLHQAEQLPRSPLLPVPGLVPLGLRVFLGADVEPLRQPSPSVLGRLQDTVGRPVGPRARCLC